MRVTTRHYLMAAIQPTIKQRCLFYSYHSTYITYHTIKQLLLERFREIIALYLRFMKWSVVLFCILVLWETLNKTIDRASSIYNVQLSSLTTKTLQPIFTPLSDKQNTPRCRSNDLFPANKTSSALCPGDLLDGFIALVTWSHYLYFCDRQLKQDDRLTSFKLW